MRVRFSVLVLLAGSALSLGGCHKAKPAGNSLDALDNELVNGSVTEENKQLAAAIKVDPARTGKRQPGDREATVPLATLADKEGGHKAGTPVVMEDSTGNPCINGLVYSNAWAGKLPADLPVHPHATVQEAAGHDGIECPIRVVSFTVPGDRQAVLGWYTAKARAGGYTAVPSDSGDDKVLAGDKGGTSYIISAGPARNGATPIDYIWMRKG